jgi:hypothetical protein
MDGGDEWHSLEFLLAFDGRTHLFESGYHLRFEIKRVAASAERPHGLRYAFTLHDPEGQRIMGFDNAHTVRPVGSRFRERPVTADHWHRDEHDQGRPYAFENVERLLEDFFAEVDRVLAERGVSSVVIGVDEEERS